MITSYCEGKFKAGDFVFIQSTNITGLVVHTTQQITKPCPLVPVYCEHLGYVTWYHSNDLITVDCIRWGFPSAKNIRKPKWARDSLYIALWLVIGIAIVLAVNSVVDSFYL